MVFDVFYASKRVSSVKDIVSQWEKGDALPTWTQVKNLAKLYNIQELIFFSDENIKENRVIPDFRVGVEEDEKDKIKKLVNLVLKRQSRLEKILKDDGCSKNKLIGSGKDIKKPTDLAKYISDRLEIDLEEIKNISGSDSRKKTLKCLINKAEDKGIFIGKTISYHNISVKNMRGLFISNNYCPFIILNKKDAVSAQIFSLIHELAHLFRKTESISNNIDFRDSNNNISPEEVFCNKVAANLLLPASEFTESFYDKDSIEHLADKYKLSELFVFYRLKDLKKIKDQDLADIEIVLKKESEENIKKKELSKDKGGNYYNNMRDSNGALFNRVVLGTYLENKINFTEASNLLSFSVEKV